MFTSSGKEREAKRLFAYLELNNKNATSLDIFISIIFFKNLIINSIKDKLMPEHPPIFGGTFLTGIGLVLGLVECVGDSLSSLRDEALGFRL